MSFTSRPTIQFTAFNILNSQFQQSGNEQKDNDQFMYNILPKSTYATVDVSKKPERRQTTINLNKTLDYYGISKESNSFQQTPQKIDFSLIKELDKIKRANQERKSSIPNRRVSMFQQAAQIPLMKITEDKQPYQKLSGRISIRQVSRHHNISILKNNQENQQRRLSKTMRLGVRWKDDSLIQEDQLRDEDSQLDSSNVSDNNLSGSKLSSKISIMCSDYENISQTKRRIIPFKVFVIAIQAIRRLNKLKENHMQIVRLVRIQRKLTYMKPPDLSQQIKQGTMICLSKFLSVFCYQINDIDLEVSKFTLIFIKSNNLKLVDQQICMITNYIQFVLDGVTEYLKQMKKDSIIQNILYMQLFYDDHSIKSGFTFKRARYLNQETQTLDRIFYKLLLGDYFFLQTIILYLLNLLNEMKSQQKLKEKMNIRTIQVVASLLQQLFYDYFLSSKVELVMELKNQTKVQIYQVELIMEEKRIELVPFDIGFTKLETQWYLELGEDKGIPHNYDHFYQGLFDQRGRKLWWKKMLVKFDNCLELLTSKIL